MEHSDMQPQHGDSQLIVARAWLDAWCMGTRSSDSTSILHPVERDRMILRCKYHH